MFYGFQAFDFSVILSARCSSGESYAGYCQLTRTAFIVTYRI